MGGLFTVMKFPTVPVMFTDLLLLARGLLVREMSGCVLETRRVFLELKLETDVT